MASLVHGGESLVDALAHAVDVGLGLDKPRKRRRRPARVRRQPESPEESEAGEASEEEEEWEDVSDEDVSVDFGREDVPETAPPRAALATLTVPLRGGAAVAELAAAFESRRAWFGGVDVEWAASLPGATPPLIGNLIMLARAPALISEPQKERVARWLARAGPDAMRQVALPLGEEAVERMRAFLAARGVATEAGRAGPFVASAASEVERRIDVGSTALLARAHYGLAANTVRQHGADARPFADAEHLAGLLFRGSQRRMGAATDLDSMMAELGVTADQMRAVRAAASRFWAAGTDGWARFTDWVKRGWASASQTLGSWWKKSLTAADPYLKQAWANLEKLPKKTRAWLEDLRAKIAASASAGAASLSAGAASLAAGASSAMKQLPSSLEKLKGALRSWGGRLAEYFRRLVPQAPSGGAAGVATITDAQSASVADAMLMTRSDVMDEAVQGGGYSADVIARVVADYQDVMDQVASYVTDDGSANPASVSMFLAAAGELARRYAAAHGIAENPDMRATFNVAVNGDAARRTVRGVVDSMKRVIAHSVATAPDGTSTLSFADGIRAAGLSDAEVTGVIEFLRWARGYALLASTTSAPRAQRALGAALDLGADTVPWAFSTRSTELTNADLLEGARLLDPLWPVVRQSLAPESDAPDSFQECAQRAEPAYAPVIRLASWLFYRAAEAWEEHPEPYEVGDAGFAAADRGFAALARLLQDTAAAMPDGSGDELAQLACADAATRQDVTDFLHQFMHPAALLRSRTFAAFLDGAVDYRSHQYQTAVRIQPSERTAVHVVPVERVLHMLLAALRLPSNHPDREHDVSYCLALLARNADAFEGWLERALEELGTPARLVLTQRGVYDNVEDVTEHVADALDLPLVVPAFAGLRTSEQHAAAYAYARSAGIGYFAVTGATSRPQ